MKEFDPTEQDERANSRLVTTAVTPRPIAWISTTSDDGTDNLAPYSSYNYVSTRRPTVQFSSPNEASGGLKDTARNAVETEEFAVNVVTESVVEQMDMTSRSVPPAESEFDLAGVTRAECRAIDPPRVAEAVVTMECTLYDTHAVQDRLVVLGEVQHFHVEEGLLTDGKIDMLKLPTVGRLGGPYYSVSEPMDFERTY